MTVAPDAMAALRDRLLEMRAGLIEQLADADRLDGGLVALLGDVGAALKALDDVTQFADRLKRRSRGGDRHANKRARRDAAVRDFAQLLGADLSLERKAQEVISKVRRFRPAAADLDGSLERQALYRIASSGVPLPNSTKQLKRILTEK